MYRINHVYNTPMCTIYTCINSSHMFWSPSVCLSIVPSTEISLPDHQQRVGCKMATLSHCTLCTVYSLQCIMFTVYIVDSVYFGGTMHSVHSVHCTLHGAHNVDSACFTVHTLLNTIELNSRTFHYTVECTALTLPADHPG